MSEEKNFLENGFCNTKSRFQFLMIPFKGKGFPHIKLIERLLSTEQQLYSEVYQFKGNKTFVGTKKEVKIFGTMYTGMIAGRI